MDECRPESQPVTTLTFPVKKLRPDMPTVTSSFTSEAQAEVESVTALENSLFCIRIKHCQFGLRFLWL